MKPLANVRRTKVYGCYLISLLRERGNTEGVNAIGRGPESWAVNCFRYNLINTSKSIDTNSAISNMLFNMPSPRESCVSALKRGRVVVKETT